MAVRVDLNADLGELPGPAGAALDEAVLNLVTSANVACGGHAGDGASMRRVAGQAAERGVAIGAHVSYPDREHFGRRDLGYPPSVLLGSLRQQIDELLAAAADVGTAVRYLKAHGALYNASIINDAPASVLLEAAREYGLPVLTLADGALAQCAAGTGVAVYAEFFADRAYEASGRLRPRGQHAAVLTDEEVVVSRVLTAVHRSTVISHDGFELRISVDSVCLHGDTPGAVGLARRVRTALQPPEVALGPFVDGLP